MGEWRPDGRGRRPGPRMETLGLAAWLAVILLLVGSWTTAPAASAQVAVDSAGDLRALFDPGYILQDRNRDGHPDFVYARVILPDDAGSAQVAAVSNLAARLTFESYGSGLDLLAGDDPGVVREGVPVVVVDRAHRMLATAGVDPRRALADLAPGEGAVQWLPPTDDLPGGGVWVAGADDTGLLAAADYLAGRYPALWVPDGVSYRTLGDTLTAYLAGPADAAEPPVRLTLRRAVVSAHRSGVARVQGVVEAATPQEVERLRRLLLKEEDGVAALVPDGLHRLELGLVGPEDTDEVHRFAPERSWREEGIQSWQPRSVSPFQLHELYTLQGIYRDTQQDLIPDRTEAHISLAGSEGAHGAARMAQRIALETAGLRLPLVRAAGRDDPTEELGFPLLYGVDHFTTTRLREEGRLGTPADDDVGPGQGFVEMVTRAVDDRPALVVSGSDEAGLEAAADVVARRLPYLRDDDPAPARGSFELAEVATEVRRFFQARSSVGQVALAVRKVEEWLDRLEAGERPGILPSDAPWPPGPPRAEADDAAGDGAIPPLAQLRLEVAADSIPPGLAPYLEELLARRLPDVPSQVALEATGFGVGDTILDRSMEFEWEVDRARELLAEEGYALLEGARSGRVELRVSEPPEVRRELATEIREELAARGLDPEGIDVVVLNAYKQGFSWIEDVVLPRLREALAGQEPGEIRIRYHHLEESDELPWQVIGSDTRWLQELFPVDAVLARELGVSDSLVVFEATREAEPTYRVLVTDSDGQVILEDTFSPAYVVEPYFHLYPDYERVRISTGQLVVEADGEERLTRRIRTDLERFWTAWQTQVLPLVRDYIMDLHRGEVSPGNAPFFDELRIDVRLSEPNHRIGIDEEVVSSLESVHNDLYFHTLAFLGHLGQHYGVGALNYAGRILPHIDPDGVGEGGSARVRLTGRSRAAPELVLRARTDAAGPRGPGEGRWRYPLSPLPTPEPALRGIRVRAGQEGVDRLLFQVAARDSVDRFQEYRGRASESAIDRNLLPISLLEGMVESTRRLHGAGVLGPALAFEDVGELAFHFVLEDDGEEEVRARTVLPVSDTPFPTTNPVLYAEGWEWDGEPMVQWETPIPPAESDSVMARLATFPEARVHLTGRSLLGREIHAADFLPAMEAPFLSQARLNALRPTVFLSGRQHANEVSSTSHLLRLGELLATDPEYRELLRKVNVVLHPVANPDGAQLAWEMQKQNPDFTLHAGYLGALGVDMTAGSGSDDPIYPEANVRPRIMEMWLPDIYLNLHGYPSHEWVQHFSGYAAWVRGRTVTSRTWWAPRGWFIPGFTWVDDPDHPEITQAQFAILDTMAAAITGEPEVQAMSERQYARYAKYGRQDVENFREHFHEGMLTYLSLRGRSVSGSGPSNPRINTFSATTEAPDETARGDWLELVSTAGLAHTSAMIRYLAIGEFEVERPVEAFQGAVERKVYRVRPVLPPEEEPGGESKEGSEGADGGPGR